MIDEEEVQKRLRIIKEVEASEALEGYDPLSPKDGYSYELQQQWARGEITLEEERELLSKYLGVAYKK